MIIFIIIIIPVLLYLPPVQKTLFDTGLDMASRATGWNITADKIDLSFPLRLTVENLVVTEDADTTIKADRIYTQVKPLSLVALKIDLDSTMLEGGYYRMTTADSTMTLSATIGFCKFIEAGVNIRKQQIELCAASLNRGDIDLYFDPDKTTVKDTVTTESSPWIISASRIDLDSLKYRMQMLPTIDSLGACIAHAELSDGYVNTGTCNVNLAYMLVDGVNAAYFTPSAEYMASHPVAEAAVVDTAQIPDSAVWIIRGKRVQLKNASGIYAVRGVKPASGLDFCYLQGDGMGFEINDFYSKGSAISVPLKYMQARERCGLEIKDANGVFSMDSSKIRVQKFRIITGNSQLDVDAFAQTSLFEMKPTAELSLDADLSLSSGDIKLAYPQFSGYLSGFRDDNPIKLKANVGGNLSRVEIDTILAVVPAVMNLKLNGVLCDALDAGRRKGNLKIAGNTYNLNRFKSLFLDKAQAPQYNLIATSLHGNVSVHGNTYATTMNMKAGEGAAKLIGKVNIASETYDIMLDANSIPIDKVMPESGFGTLTAGIDAKGRIFNPLTSGAEAFAKLDIQNLSYNGFDFKDIIAVAQVNDGMGDIRIESSNTPLDFCAQARSTLIDCHYDYDVTLDARNVDLFAMKLSQDTMKISGNMQARGLIDLNEPMYSVDMTTSDVVAQIVDKELRSKRADLSFKSDTTTAMSLSERDLKIVANSGSPLDTLLAKLTSTADTIGRQMSRHAIDFGEINALLPVFYLSVNLGNNNIVNDYLKQDDMSLRSANISVTRDSILNLTADAYRIKLSDMTFDTVRIRGNQHGQDMLYSMVVANKPGNLDQFALTDVKGKISSNSADILLHQINRKGDTGFNFGISSEYTDDELKVNLFPENPVIGYRTWALNKDNYIEFNPRTRHIDANVDLKSDAGYVSLITEHVNDSVQEDLMLKAGGINLAEWLNVSPFMPKVAGMLDANAIVRSDKHGMSGNGFLGLSGLMYNKKQLGTIDLDMSLSTDTATGENVASAAVQIDGRRAITARGVIGAKNDSVAGGMNYDVSIDRFPLEMANPFIPQGLIELSGYLSGDASLRGSSEQPLINGKLYCDSTMLKLPVFGSRMNFGNEKIDVVDNNVQFNDFKIRGINNNPISINGNVNLAPLSNPMVNLSLSGEDVQLVDSKYTSRSQVFGKAYVDMNAQALGRMNKLKARAYIDILPKTNVTYVMQEDVSTLSQSSNSDMVRFVNFNDTIEDVVENVPEDGFNLDLDAVLNVQQGSTVNVNLSPDGKNKVQLSGAGTLTYSMDGASEGRLSGRYTINNGFVRYYPPFISEKYFTFTPGSYVAFNGNMMNPTLAITAVGNQATTVMSDGTNPMRVNFQITASVTNTLDDMKVNFDLAAPNNSLIETELQSSTPAQRSAQAINLMLYGTYSSGQTSTASSTNANMLYSLLSSQLNNLASKVVKGVDISFGINQYNTSNSSSSGTNTNYSYSVSKSLFDDRFKMTVGGNYDTGESSDVSVAQNLFSNISFEYRLNQSGTMSLQLYNKVTDNNIYQTQVNETGLAFTLRKKIANLLDVFRNVKSKFVKPAVKKPEQGEALPKNDEDEGVKDK